MPTITTQCFTASGCDPHSGHGDFFWEVDCIDGKVWVVRFVDDPIFIPDHADVFFSFGDVLDWIK